MMNDLLTNFRSIVSDDLQMLAVLHTAEPDKELLSTLKQQQFPDGLGLKLESESGLAAIDFMQRTINALPKSINDALLDELAADYADIYLTHAIQASPYESVWLDEDHLACQEMMFQVRDYYQRHGLAAADWRQRADDHLVLQLQFIAHLLHPQQPDHSLEEAATFMDEHLLRWLDEFAWRVAKRANTDYFAAIALLTNYYCETLREYLADILDKPRPTIEDINQQQTDEQTVPVKFIPGVAPSW